MYVDTSLGPEFYGFLVNSDNFANMPKEARIHLELYDYPNNKKVKTEYFCRIFLNVYIKNVFQLWEDRYIHPEYFAMLKPDTDVPLACPDVYDFPFLSERFCREIIEVMEHFGEWSSGKHKAFFTLNSVLNINFEGQTHSGRL